VRPELIRPPDGRLHHQVAWFSTEILEFNQQSVLGRRHRGVKSTGPPSPVPATPLQTVDRTGEDRVELQTT